MQVSKWGNSLAVRLPASLVQELDLKEGDDIEITVREKAKMEVERRPGLDDLLAKVRSFKGRGTVDFKFDRDEANER